MGHENNTTNRKRSIIKKEIFEKMKHKNYLNIKIFSGIIDINKYLFGKIKTYCVI